MSTTQDSASPRRYTPKLRASWIPMVLTVLMVGVVGLLGYLGLQYIRGSTFQEGRSFRVLGEVAQQLDNMQGSLGSLLALIPESVLEKKPAKNDRLQARHHEVPCTLVPGKVAGYLDKLDLQRLELKNATDGVHSATPRFTIFLDDPGRPFTIRSDVTFKGAGEGNRDLSCPFQLRGSLQIHLPAFTGQRYFEEVLIALSDGTVLATLPRRDAHKLEVFLHADSSDPVPIANAASLLEQGARVAAEVDFNFGKGTPPPLKQGAAPSQAVAFTRSIGERSYEVSVLPVSVTNPIYVDRRSGDVGGAQSVDTLYLIGAKHLDLAQQASQTLGSGGAFVATLIVLLGVLLWPFLSLRFSPVDSAIAGFQVFAVVVALILLPVVFTASAVWMWSQVRLGVWADRAAETYAAQIEQTLHDELNEAAWLLSSYVKFAQGDDPPAQGPETGTIRGEGGGSEMGTVHVGDSPRAYIRRSMGGAAVTAGIDQVDCENENRSCRWFLSGATEPLTPLKNWSPLRTAVMLDTDARNLAPRISAYGDVPVRTELSLSDRKYFQALRADQGWKPRWTYAGTAPFVAQRLFNRADAARVLQVAVTRISHGPEGIPSWKGIITGDTRVYSLTATVKPPLLRFAVIDSGNGEVLFHSSDERSLSENFLVETERNARLEQMMAARGGGRRSIDLVDHFNGQYLGESHRFYYRGLSGTPWGVVVFYPTQALSEISFDAAIATLSHCIALVALIVLTMTIVAFLWNKRIDKYLLAGIWPQWEWRMHYPRIAFALTGFILVTFIALIGGWRSGLWLLPLVVIVLGAIACVVVIARTRWQPMSNPGIGVYRLFYSWAAVALLTTLVALPTLFVGARYQDIAVAQYLRAQLADAARDVQRREQLMQRDLSRWVPSDQDRYRNYPDARTLATALPVPGFHTMPRNEERECHNGPPTRESDYCWHLTVFDRLPWIDVSGPPESGWFRRAIWRSVTTGSPNRGVGVQAWQKITGKDPDATLGHSIVVKRSFGEIEAPGVLPAERKLDRSPACDGSRPCLRESEDVQFRDEQHSRLTALVLAVAVLLIVAWLVSIATRRLFGIRIPFAARFVDPPVRHLPFAALLSTEQRIDQARAEFGKEFTGKDAIDIRRIESGPHYRELWRSLSGQERHLLVQLARGCFANPENAAVIESLLHRGFIRLRPWSVITDPGLADFARTACDRDEFHQDQLDWASAEAGSTWHRIRIPLMSGGIMIAIGLMAFAGGTMQIILTSLAGLSALLGHLTNLTNFVRRSEPVK